MTNDNVRDLMDQCHADGCLFLIAVAECTDNGCQFTVWDNIKDAGVKNGEREFIDDVIQSFKEQKRW